MDIFEKCKRIYEAVRYFTYGIPVDGVIKNVPTAEYFDENYRFLSPQEFVDLEGGVCWDYVEYERTCCENHGLKYHQYYIITDTPPNYDTHTFITVEDGDELIYIESSFKKVEHIIDGVKRFKSLEEIVSLITTTMFSCNGNDKRFDEIKYDVMEYHGHPAYGCSCEEYMNWMNENGEMALQGTAVNPKNISTDELTVEEMAIPEYHTHEDDEEYNETLHDHIKDEDDIYNESTQETETVQRGRNLADPDGVMSESGKSKEELEQELAKYIKTVKKDDVYNESWTDFKNGVHPSSGLMFHVSLKNDMDGKTINPQLPSYITDGGKLDDNYQEDTKTKRLCVSPSIEGCLIAILNYNKIREHVGDKFYVYTPEKPFSQYKHKTNKEIVKDKLVFDANITKEAWILEPCKLKLYGIIKLKKVKDLKEKPTVEKNIKMNTIKLDYEWIMTPKVSGKFNKAIGDSPDKEDDTKEQSIKEYTTIMEGFYDDKAKSHSGGVYGIYDLSDDYISKFCNIILQGHNTEYLGWNAPKGEELITKTFEVVRSEEWSFNKSDRKNVIPDYSQIFTYASQILPIIRLEALGEEHIKDLKAPSTLFTIHDPNSNTDIKYLCVIPQVLDVIDKSKTSYVYDEGMNDLFADHIVYNSDLVDQLGMFRVKHDHPVAGTYDDNEFFESIFKGPKISSKLFDIFNNFNSIRLFDISDVSAWDLAVDAEEHYSSDGKKINPGDPDHPYNKSVTEYTNVLVSNEEFFMEASKNPDVKARKRTVNNLRKLGVDRAHEVDNKQREIDRLTKKYENGDIDFSTYYEQRAKLEGENYRSLGGRGVDIKVKDSYGNKHKTRFRSDDDDDYYINSNDEINISPTTFNSNKFKSSFNHEAGHVEQHKRLGLTDDYDSTNYNITSNDDYVITCAKLFLKKNHNKMNSHDIMWTELHADFLSAKKCGFGSMIKDIYSFKRSKEEIETDIKDLIKENDETIKNLEDRYLVNNAGYKATQKDVDECIKLCAKAQEKNEHYRETLDQRIRDLKTVLGTGNLGTKKEAKLNSLLKKISKRISSLKFEYFSMCTDFRHNGITIEAAEKYKYEIKNQKKEFNEELSDLKREFTTYDYRIKFLEDMKHIHEGHPGRCSMKYPPMTPEDKKYMMEADCILISNEEFFESR